MRLRMLDDSVPIYPTSDGSSQPISHLQWGTELPLIKIVKRANGNWFALYLGERQTGYISAETPVYQIRKLLVSGQDAQLYAEPGSNVVLKTLKKATFFTCLDNVSVNGEEWLRIEDAAGQAGFLPPGTKVASGEALPAIEEYVKRPVALGKILLGAVLSIGGTAMSIGSFQEAQQKGGTYVVTWGAVLYGIVLLIQGIVQFIKGYP